MSLNKAMIIGHLGRDPEMRYLTSGEAVVNFPVATTDKWKDRTTGEQKEQTEWHRVSFFGRLAEVAGEYLKKGSLVYIEGKINSRKYTDKDGVERTSTEIRGSEMKMLGKPTTQGEQQPRTGAAPGAAQRQAAPQGSGFDDMTDDIPF